jgi:hypothetical protein
VAVFQRRANVAVLAGLAVGVVVTMASGELRADRDVELELVRANETLADRLDAQEQEIAELRSAIATAAGKPTTLNPGSKQPGTGPKSKAETELEELLAFKKKVLNAIKPELDAIDARAKAGEDALAQHVTAYAKHTHDVELVSHGWVKLDTMLTTEGTEMLRPTYPDDWIAIRRDGKGGTYPKQTSKPK